MSETQLPKELEQYRLQLQEHFNMAYLERHADHTQIRIKHYDQIQKQYLFEFTQDASEIDVSEIREHIVQAFLDAIYEDPLYPYLAIKLKEDPFGEHHLIILGELDDDPTKAVQQWVRESYLELITKVLCNTTPPSTPLSSAPAQQASRQPEAPGRA